MADDLFENKTLQLAAELEAEIERELAIQQYDYVSPVSDLQESTVEVSNLKGKISFLETSLDEKQKVRRNGFCSGWGFKFNHCCYCGGCMLPERCKENLIQLHNALCWEEMRVSNKNGGMILI